MLSSFLRSLALVSLVSVLSTAYSLTATAAIVTWIGGAGNWSDGGNWDGGLPPGPTDTARFSTDGGSSTSTMDLGPSAVIEAYEIHLDTTNTTRTLALGSNSLSMNNMSLAVTSPSTTAHFGHLNVTGSAGSALNIAGTLNMGTDRVSRASLNLAPDVALNIGEANNRGNLYLIQHTSVSHATNTASLTSGSVFNAWLDNLYVGRQNTGGDPNNSVATLNLSNVTSGVLNVSGDVLIGEHFGVTGVATLSEHVDFKIGIDANNRGRLRIASGGGNRPDRPVSSLTLEGGTIEAYLTELSVGYTTATSTWASTSNAVWVNRGLLDLTDVSGGLLDIDGDFRVGTVVRGTQHSTANDSDNQTQTFRPRAHGTVRLGEIDVTAKTLEVGHPENIDDGSGTGQQNIAGSGLLELYGTRLFVSDAVTIDGVDSASRGRIVIETDGQSGLDLGENATLTIGEGEIDITFLEPSEALTIYWGLRWQGDHLSDLLSLSSAITWDDAALVAAGYSPVQIFFNGGFTYVGSFNIIPEPGTGLLLAAALPMLLMRRTRRRGE